MSFLVVKELPIFLLDDFPSIHPEREIDFGIYLLPDTHQIFIHDFGIDLLPDTQPIFIHSYSMNPMKLKHLKN